MSGLLLASLACSWCCAQPTGDGLSPPDETTQRYWQVLSRNPRPGTAFDNWYSGYVDRGELSALTAALRKMIAAEPQDANTHILLGLVLRRQGQLTDAAKVFQTASQAAPERYDPHFLRGMTLAEARNYPESIAAFQAAVSLMPRARVTRAGVVQLFNELGRAQQLAGDRDAAVATWQKLATLFPQDQRVQAQVASWLQHEAHWAAALAAWQRAEKLMTDSYARLEAQLAIADIHSQLNDRTAALNVLDKALGQAKPGSWLDQSIRKRIETLHDNDSDALVAYLRQRSEHRPEELETVLQLSQALSRGGDRREAIQLLRDAVQRASRRTDIRLALLDLLRQDKQRNAAIEEADILVRQNPLDIELLQLAGEVRLTDVDKPYTKAVVDDVLALWKRIPELRPDDPRLAAQTAELCLGAAGLDSSLAYVSPASRRSRYADDPFVRAAEAFFHHAIELSTDKAVYYEYLGRLYHDTGRREQAIATLRQLTTAESTAVEWSRLADLFRQLGYQNEALQAIQQAIAIAPDDADNRQMCVDLLRSRGDQAGALRELDAAIERLQRPRDIAAALESRIEILSEGGLLNDEIKRLRDAATNREPTWQELWQLGLAHKSQGDMLRAQTVLETAVALLPDEPRLATVLAETCLANQDAPKASLLFTRLAKLEPHLRATHIGRIVDLQLKENNLSAARDTAERLFEVPTNRASDYLQRASIANMIDEPDRALQMLRRAVQVAPRDVESRLALAQELAHRQSGEAMDHYWRAFPLLDDLTDKASLLKTMHNLDDRQFASQIVPRLKREREAASEKREVTICLAEALLLTGDDAAAVDCLVHVLKRNADDVGVLSRLADVALQSDEYMAAAGHLKRIAELTDKPDDWRRLLAVQQKIQDDEACIRIASRLATQFGDQEAFAQLFDSTYRISTKRALHFAREGLQRYPHDWRLKFRLTAEASQGQRQSTFAEALGETLQACLADPQLTTSAEQRLRTYSVEALANTNSVSMGRNAVLLQLGRDAKQLNRHLVVFRELLAFNAAASPFKPQRSRRSRRSPPTLNVPDDPFLAALHCLRALGTAGIHEIPRQAEGGQPEWILLRLEIIHYATSEQIWSRLNKILQYAKLRPEDPLPHLVRFYEPIPQTVSAEPYIAALRESFAWFHRRSPELATRLSGNYAQQLVFANQHGAAAEVLANHVDQADSLVTLVGLAPICLQVQVPGFRERFLTRALELIQAPGTIPEDVADVLLVAFNEPKRQYKESEWVAVLALLEQHLKTPSRFGRARTVTSPRTFQTVPRRNIQLAQALRNPSLSAAQKQRLIEIMRRNQFGSPRGRRPSSGQPSVDGIMTTSNPYLSAYQREILLRAFSQAANGGKDAMLLKWFSDKAAEPKASLPQQVAYPVMLWMSADTAAASVEFARLSEQHPQDVYLRMLAATAAYEANRLDEAFLLLSDKSLEGSRVESDMVLLRSRVNAALSSLTDYDMGLRCLLAALEHQTVPYLYPFFSRQKNPYPDFATLPAGGGTTEDETRQPRQPADWLLAGDRPSRSPVILGILDRAWQIDNRIAGQETKPDGSERLGGATQLGRLEALVQQNLALHPRNQELAAVEVLIMLRKEDFSSARQRMTHWNPTAESSAWTSATTAELARVLCRFDPTESVGFQLVCDYIIANAASGAAQRGGQLLTDVTYALSDQELPSREGRTVRFWQTYFDTMIDHGEEKDLNDAAEVVSAALAILGQAAHDTLPAAVGQLAEATNGPTADRFVPHKIGPALFMAIRAANLHWVTSDRNKALDALRAITFPTDPTGPCRLWQWYQFPNADQPLKRYSIGELIVALSVDTKQLTQLRQQLHSSPRNQDPEMIALQLEAANADNDLATLIPMATAARKRAGPNPPVWSADLIDDLDPDLYMLGVVLRNSGKAKLNTGETVRRLDQIPTTPFYIQSITLSSPQFKDPGLRRLNKPKAIKGLTFERLRQVSELDLTNLAIGNEELGDLRHLTQLAVLRLDGTDVTDQVISQLVQIESLRELSLRRTKITKSGIHAIRETLPECKVIPPGVE